MSNSCVFSCTLEGIPSSSCLYTTTDSNTSVAFVSNSTETSVKYGIITYDFETEGGTAGQHDTNMKVKAKTILMPTMSSIEIVKKIVSSNPIELSIGFSTGVVSDTTSITDTQTISTSDNEEYNCLMCNGTKPIRVREAPDSDERIIVITTTNVITSGRIRIRIPYMV